MVEHCPKRARENPPGVLRATLRAILDADLRGGDLRRAEDPDTRALTVRVLLCPPLLYRSWHPLRSRLMWWSYFFSWTCIAVGLYMCISGEPGWSVVFFGGLLSYFLCLTSLGHTLSRLKAEVAVARHEGSPRAWLWIRPVEGLATGGVFVAILLAWWLLMSFGDRSGLAASRMTEALWEAEWIVEQSRQYQRAEGRNPESLAELMRRLPETDIEATDPWGREWVLSPANSGDLWACSPGPAGRGRCRPENLGAIPRSAGGSVGYSARFGGWSDAAGPSRFAGLEETLPLLLIVAPLLGYLAYRVYGRPGPAQRTMLGALILIFVLGFIARIPPWASANVAARQRVEQAEAHFRIISAAILRYQAHMWSSPATLSDLTVAVTSSRGRRGGPFLKAVPAPPPGGRAQYTYKRFADGRYVLKYSDPWRTVLARWP